MFVCVRIFWRVIRLKEDARAMPFSLRLCQNVKSCIKNIFFLHFYLDNKHFEINIYLDMMMMQYMKKTYVNKFLHTGIMITLLKYIEQSWYFPVGSFEKFGTFLGKFHCSSKPRSRSWLGFLCMILYSGTCKEMCSLDSLVVLGRM